MANFPTKPETITFWGKIAGSNFFFKQKETPGEYDSRNKELLVEVFATHRTNP